MKKSFLVILVLIIISCKTDNSSISKEQLQDTSKNTTLDKSLKNSKPLTKFVTLKEMFESSNDFSEEAGTLKFISVNDGKIHVQVSKPILASDAENVKNEIVKRDIVYVAFQTFAQTDINDLIITSLPLDYDNPKNYIEKYKKTVKINREKAKTILRKYLNTEDFSILYEEQNGMWLPGKNFSILKFDKLEDAYNDISN